MGLAKMNFFAFKKREDINSQNTGLLALQRVLGLTLVPSNGGAGIVSGVLNATNPATVVIGPSHKLNDPTVTGNVSASPQLQMLSNPTENLISAVTGNI